MRPSTGYRGESSGPRRGPRPPRPGGGPGGHQSFKRRPFPRKKICRFCAQQIPETGYRDVELLRKFLTEKGKIIPRRTTGNCAKCQRKLVRSIKRARHAALLAFQEV